MTPPASQPVRPALNDPGCIFCKIVAGKISCHRLYEDDDVISFLDIGPLSRGHCLIIPRAHYATIDVMDPDLAAACARVVVKLSRAIVAAIGPPAWNVLQNNGSASGQVVGHVHFHIIPRREGDGLGFRWPAGTLDSEEAQRLVREITGQLGQ